MDMFSSLDVESGEDQVGSQTDLHLPTLDGIEDAPPNPAHRGFRGRWNGRINGLRGRWNGMVDGFKEHGLSRKEEAHGVAGRPPLNKHLKRHHLQFIAFGGAIGTGLFVGCGQALAAGGPGSLFIGFLLIGIDLYFTIYSLLEMTLVLDQVGAFSVHSTRFINKPWGFAMGWNYALQWLIVLPLELVALTITFRYWTDRIPPIALSAIFLALIFGINLFGVRGYGEIEMMFAVLKIAAVIGFSILGIVIDAGGIHGKQPIGGKYWHNPGAFKGGWNGFFNVLVIAAFAFSGTEIVCLAAAENNNPAVNLPKAVKRTFWRILIFYTLSVLVVGLLVPYNDPRLLSEMGTDSANARASPFVIAIENAGIKGVPSLFNAVILVTVLSVGNTSTYASSRMLVALSVQGQAPRIFSYVDRKGRPQVALLVSFGFGCLSLLSQVHDNETLFRWLLALSGLSAIITWGSVCLAHIRCRSACDAQGKTEQLPYKSPYGIWGSLIGLTINGGVVAGQFAEVIMAVEWSSVSSPGRMGASWSYFLAIPLFALCYWAYVIIERCRDDKLSMDLDTGTNFLVDGGPRPSRVVEGTWWRKVYDILC